MTTVTLMSLPAGGIAHYSYALASALEKAGVRSTVLMLDDPPYDLADFPHQHRALTTMKTGLSWRARITNPLRNVAPLVAAARGSDVVHYQWPLGPRSDPAHWLVLRRLGKKIVYTAHDVIPHEPTPKHLAHSRWLYHGADALIVHGANLKTLLVERFAVDPGKVRVIPHGNYNFVADTPGPWDRPKARASLDLEDGDRVVLFFGIIRPYKGLDDLIEACRIIAGEGLGAGQRLRVLIAGQALADYWQKGGYEQQIERAGLRDAVRLHIQYISMREVPRFFLAADAVAVPYKRGSQSGVLQLAYSFGKPAVATRVGSLEEVTQSGRIARLVPPESPAALAASLRGLLVDPAEGAKLGAEARRYAETELGWGSIVEKTREVYASVAR